MEYHERNPLACPFFIKVVQNESRSQENIAYILRLEEELKKVQTIIEERSKYIEDLKSKLKAKDKLVNSLRHVHLCAF